MSDDKYGDIIGELLKEVDLLPETDYCAELEEVDSDIGHTFTKKLYYVKTKFDLAGVKVYVYFGGPLHTLKFVHHAMTRYVGSRVKIRIKHKTYNNRTFMDGEVLEWLDHGKP